MSTYRKPRSALWPKLGIAAFIVALIWWASWVSATCYYFAK